MPNHALTKLFRPEVLAMSAYHVADARNLIKLDAMENPYTWPEDIQQRWLESLKTCPINRYPDPTGSALCEQLRRANAIPDHAALLLGNGSDEIIQILLMALSADATVLAPEPGFVMYRQIARSLGLNYVGVPLATDFALDLSAMLAAIADNRPAAIFIAYPNNPTGNLFDAQAIKTIIAAAPGLVVVDEAYAPFADASFVGELGNYPNLLVMRTVSKLGLAGLRLGYLAGPAEIVAELDKVRLPYNINSLTQATVGFALEHGDFLAQQTQAIRAERTAMAKALKAWPTLTVYPSSANFILFRTPAGTADQLFAGLKARGILIKNLSGQGGVLSDCLRVTIGKPEENQSFLNALAAALAELPR